MRKFLEEASDRLFKLKNADKNYTELLIRKERLLDEIYLLSVKLSRERRVEAEKFRNEVLASLGELGMASADFPFTLQLCLKETHAKNLYPKRAWILLNFIFQPMPDSRCSP